MCPTPPLPGFAFGLHRRRTLIKSRFVHVARSSSAAQLTDSTNGGGNGGDGDGGDGAGNGGGGGDGDGGGGDGNGGGGGDGGDGAGAGGGEAEVAGGRPEMELFPYGAEALTVQPVVSMPVKSAPSNLI